MRIFIFKWLRNVSIARKLYFVVGIMALLIAMELFMLVFTIHTLSSTRAYVGGEGLWSKAEKDAVYSLRKYGESHRQEDYNLYQSFLQVNLGDSKARLEMGKENPDFSIVRKGFLEGRNHPNDIDGMIKLFRRFNKIYYINQAILAWTEADSLMTNLVQLGARLHNEIYENKWSSQEKINGILSEIDLMNRKLTLVEDRFSYTLGEGSRWLENLILKILFSIALTVEFSGLFLTISVSIGISKGINEIVRVASRVAKADFSEKAKVFSKDEIGELAGSFNTMVGDLQKRIEERDEAAESLQRQKNLYETLVFAQSEMGEGVAITEREKIIYANEALCNMYGYSMEEILAIPSFIDLVPEQEREALANRLQQRLAGDGMSDKGETSLVRKDGSVISIEYSLKMVKMGERKQLVSIIRDVTDKIKARQLLAAHANELKRSNQELEQFAYIASHDLQEPLRSIISYLQLIEKRYKNKIDADADEYINFAVEGAGRMHALINDLLTYSRIGRPVNNVERADCASILDVVLHNLRNTIEENNATIIFDTAMPVLKADPLQMIQLFQNLIANAIKFKGALPPEIHIAAKKQNDEWLFSVKDNGIGIFKQYAERIFVIFQRLHSRKEYPGTGIGLAVCKKIVEQHGGKIWMESDGDKGSIFYFTIKVS